MALNPTLAELCAPWPELGLEGDLAVPITGVVEDSRLVGPGTLFVAVKGHGRDGHDHVGAAVAAGAVAVAVDEARCAAIRAALPPSPPVAWVTAPCTRGLPARLAREFEGRPDTALCVAGVTGTNGKTTTAFLLQSMLGRLRGPCGLLGTIRYDDGHHRVPAPLTTPAGPVLYHWLGRMVRERCAAVAMEVSSHALDQERAGPLALDVAVLTNFGRDHLDYHGDLARYLAAKARILELLHDHPHRGKPPGVAVVNAADPALAPLAASAPRAVTFVADPIAPASADLRVTDARLGLTGTELTFLWRGRTIAMQSPLVGRFNIENLTAALASGLALGYDPEACALALAEVAQVPGRLERFAMPQGALAVVDYAHTHDALAAVLRACRELGGRRLIVVFGCGGDRDRGKRSLMGRVAAELADTAWITSDNPRGEDPAAITAEIVAGFDTVAGPRATGREVILDRRTAIDTALAAAGPNDVVVIAGKGHEDYQLVQGRVLALDDRQIVRDWIAQESRDG